MNASKHIRITVLVALLGALAGCGGGGGSARPNVPELPPPTCPDGQVGTPPNCVTPPPDPDPESAILEKYNRFLSSGDQSVSWPEFGEYTHNLVHLLGSPVGGGDYVVQPFNVACVEVNCSWDEVLLNESNTIESISHVMDHANISVFRVQGRNAFYSSFEAWGAWLESTAFNLQRTCGVSSECERRGGFSGSIVAVDGRPSNSNPRGGGSATWIGIVTAADTVTHNIILGDARITIDVLSSPDVDVSLTGLWDVTEGIRRGDISWHDLPLSGGSFGAGSAPFGTLGPGGDFVYGQFYGNAHQEVGGRFEHPSTQTRGAFGGKRH